MVMHKNVPYIRCRDGIYYFVRRVPDDVKSYYSSDRICVSPGTKLNLTLLKFRYFGIM